MAVRCFLPHLRNWIQSWHRSRRLLHSIRIGTAWGCQHCSWYTRIICLNEGVISFNHPFSGSAVAVNWLCTMFTTLIYYPLQHWIGGWSYLMFIIPWSVRANTQSLSYSRESTCSFSERWTFLSILLLHLMKLQSSFLFGFPLVRSRPFLFISEISYAHSETFIFLYRHVHKIEEFNL